MKLPEPARYRPWSKGVYDVAPNLRPFGTDFGNAEQDANLFLLDREWPDYLASKRDAVEEDPSKYIARAGLPERLESAAASFIATRLAVEHPEIFCLSHGMLHCAPLETAQLPELDMLLRLTQEDLAIVVADGAHDRICYVNVCNPSHWRPTDKIGRSFFEAHLPIPGFERINRAASAMVQSMIQKGPFVRFVWGLESDSRLNHHPLAPPGVDQGQWYGRRFDEGVFIRVERQVTWPLPELSAALFFIRPIVYSSAEIQAEPENWRQLIAALHSMNAEARAYKGIPDALIEKLANTRELEAG